MKLISHLHIQSCTKSHPKFPIEPFVKYPLEGLLEERSVEGVSHHHVSSAKEKTIHKGTKATGNQK